MTDATENPREGLSLSAQLSTSQLDCSNQTSAIFLGASSRPWMHRSPIDPQTQLQSTLNPSSTSTHIVSVSHLACSPSVTNTVPQNGPEFAVTELETRVANFCASRQNPAVVLPSESTVRHAISQHSTDSTPPALTVIEIAQNPSEEAAGTAHLPSTDFNTKSYVAKLSYVVSAIQARFPLSVSAAIRIQWLRSALVNDDRPFCALHQLLCMWTLHRPFLKTLAIGEDCAGGFMVLQSLLGDNAVLPHDLLDFFTSFPGRYDLLVGRFRSQPRTAETIHLFLSKLVESWTTLRHSCLDRRYPPVPRELSEHLRCLNSITLETAFYLSIERQINPQGSSIWHRLSCDLFRAAREQYEQRTKQCLSHTVDLSYYKLILSEERSEFRIKYQQLLDKCHGKLRAPVKAPHTTSVSAQLRHSQIVPLLSNANSTLRAANATTLESSYRGRVGTPSARTVPSSRYPVQIGIPSPLGSASPMYVSTSDRTLGQTRQNLPLNQQSLHSRPLQGVVTHAHHSQAFPEVRANSTVAARFNPRKGVVFHQEPLLPRINQLPTILTNPEPQRSALHQAHLWQPLTVTRTDGQGIKPTRLYQFIKGLIVSPRLISEDAFYLEVEFEVPAESFARRATTTAPSSASFQTSERYFENHSVLFHFRCVNGRDTTPPDESMWAGLPTCYPEHIFISLNDHDLEVRRRRHFKRDLPIDVTTFIKQDDNKLTVSYYPGRNESSKQFYISVEIIEVIGEENARSLATLLPHEVVYRSMMDSLQRNTSDDELSIIAADTLTIDLVDPFLSHIFTTPVRGKTCHHRECFDLGSFLLSRTSDMKDELTSVYQWSCPYCGKDARPASLIIDEFLLEVRTRLADMDRLDARAIIVRQDGSWTVKPVDGIVLRASQQRPNATNAQANINVHDDQVTVRLKADPDETDEQPNDAQPVHITASRTNLPNPQSLGNAIEIVVLDEG